MSPFDGGLKEGEGICFSSVLGYWIGLRLKTSEKNSKWIGTPPGIKSSVQYADFRTVFKRQVWKNRDTSELKRIENSIPEVEE